MIFPRAGRLTAAMATTLLAALTASQRCGASAPQPTVYAYRLHAGDQTRYHVAALFSGHIPPFSDSASPPIHIRIVLEYLATVKSASPGSAEVRFAVQSAALSLLEKAPAEGARIDPATETPLPIPLSQVQKTLDVTAFVRPDGSVSKVTGGPEVNKIDFGFDMRKLFLLTMPVAFSNLPVRVNETWGYSDGLLGQNPGKTSYTGRIVSATGPAMTVASTGETNVDEARDRDDHPTQLAASAVTTVTGTVKVEGRLQYMGAVGAKSSLVRLKTGKLMIVADLKRHRLKPDPDNPTAPTENHIDIHGTLDVAAESAAAPAAASHKTPAKHKRPRS